MLAQEMELAELNVNRFAMLLAHVHGHLSGNYLLYDNEGTCVAATYDTDFESDNGLEADEEGYEEYQCIVFQRVSDGTFFEVNYHEIPVKVICDGKVVYD